MKSSTYCINLDRRTDKWNDVKEEFKRVGLYDDMIRFPAYPGGWRGCRDSHIAIMRMAQHDDIVEIFEDDVRFFDIKPKFYAMDELPDDWDVLYYGGSPQEPQEQYSKHLYYARNVLCMHAYAITNKNGCIDFILEHKKDIAKIDDYFAHTIQHEFKCFLVRPPLCYQKQYSSDTCKRSDVQTILDNCAKFCK